MGAQIGTLDILLIEDLPQALVMIPDGFDRVENDDAL
jgi:hypothetical protein